MSVSEALRKLLVVIPLVVASASFAACGERGFDIYMQGLAQSEQADKVHCQMLWDEGASAMVINSEKLIECKRAHEEVLVTIRRAQEAGFTGKDVDRVVSETQGKLDKLASRLKVVSYMERQMELE
jgi:hypothetical protein